MFLAYQVYFYSSSPEYPAACRIEADLISLKIFIAEFAEMTDGRPVFALRASPRQAATLG
jgi:hypothetical protein